MFDRDGRFAWVILLARWLLIAGEIWLAVSLVVAVVEAVPSIGSDPSVGTIFRNVLAILGYVVYMATLLVAYGLIDVIVSTDQAASDLGGRVTRVETVILDTATSLKTLVDLGRLTDKAKGYIYREHELEALRETIRHHMILQDHEAASRLIDDMEDNFGYTEEADRLRNEVDASRKATLEEKIDAAIARFQHILDRHDWERAAREAARMTKAMPDNEKIASLPQRVEDARTAHKRQLLQLYGEATRNKDVDKSIELLHQLDGYLTPQEAAALQESARGVFRAKLQNLGFQFTMAVTDQRWAEAIATGEEIIRDFPNSRMAMEVREKMGLLKTRAAGGPVPT